MEWTRKSIFKIISEDSQIWRVYWTESGKISSISDQYKKFCANVFFHPGGKSLRLNYDGVKILNKCFASFKVDILDQTRSRERMPSKHFVFLTRYCKAPYYIGRQYITFFDEEEALVFKLCDGDIENVTSVSN